MLFALENGALANVEMLSAHKRLVKMTLNMNDVWHLNNFPIMQKLLKAIRTSKRVYVNFYGKYEHLGISHYDGFHQDKKLCGGVRLLFKTLSAIEFGIFCRWKLEYENIAKLSDDCYLICVVCFDDTNCLDYQFTHIVELLKKIHP